MRAVVQDRYGPPAEVLAVRDVEAPSPAADEVLVRVQAASVHPDVWHVVTGRPYVLRLMGSGVRRPTRRIPGTDMAGQVVLSVEWVTAADETTTSPPPSRGGDDRPSVQCAVAVDGDMVEFVGPGLILKDSE